MIMPHKRRVVRSGEPGRLCTRARSGLGPADVIVLIVLFVLAVLILLMFLPRGREQARMTACQYNLAHVGYAVALHDALENRLPVVSGTAAIDSPRENRPKSPLLLLLENLQQPDLLGIADPNTRPKPRPGEVPGEMPVRGFVCASDPNATAGLFPAPISYRACTGDSPAGENGAFAPRRVISLREIQDRDGMSYTAAFSERLAGNNVARHPATFNYMIADGPLGDGGCPKAGALASWRGDAGSSWVSSGFPSTLYNHALPPYGQPSCIEAGGKAAYMGASSGHVAGVNLLFTDGRVTVVRPTVDRKIWKAFARIGDGEAESAGK
jgi:hypothetical protein